MRLCLHLGALAQRGRKCFELGVLKWGGSTAERLGLLAGRGEEFGSEGAGKQEAIGEAGAAGGNMVVNRAPCWTKT